MANDEPVLKLQVDKARSGKRADKVVTELLRELGHPTPRAEVQRWMTQGNVRVAGAPIDKKTRLEAGTAIVVKTSPPELSEAIPDPSVRFEVVFEDAYLLVVDKPPGLVVHPARGHATGTLVNGLLARGGFDAAPSDPRDPEGHLRPGIVHRIDRYTSGLMVVAKDSRSREGLKSQFAAHSIERCYLAIVVGQGRSARYVTTHGRHPTNRLKFTSKLASDRPGTRQAITEIAAVKHLQGASLVRCTLATGRTHQIRVHLAEQANTPILADALYGRTPPSALLKEAASALGRQALHAAVLGFVHPISGDAMRWESPLPTDMAHALDSLEL